MAVARPTLLLLAALTASCQPGIGKIGAADDTAPATDSPPGDSDPPVDSTDDTAPPTDGDDTGEADDTPANVEEEDLPDLVYEHLPVLLIDTYGSSIGDSTKVEAWLEIVRVHDGDPTELGDAPRAFEGPIGIEINGSSSSGFVKLSYRFETRDELGEDLDAPLLDMPAGADWVLHGPYSDKSLIRNAFAYTLGRTLAEDTDEWQPRIAFTEVVLNDSYQGVYLLVERIDRGDDRIDIPRVADTEDDGDLTGGYILKVDQHRGEGWTTARGTPIDYHYPRYAVLTDDQDDYIQGYFGDFETMLRSDDWDDETLGWPAWIASASWVDHLVINELAHNIDGYRLSAYMYKDADEDGGLLHSGPLWDFNLGFGNVNYCYCEETSGWTFSSLARCGYSSQYPFWWSKLLSDPNFQSELGCRWATLREGAMSDEALIATIEALALQVAEAEERDHDKWGNLGTYVWPNNYVGETWDDELDYMEAWVLERAAWLDTELVPLCASR